VFHLKPDARLHREDSGGAVVQETESVNLSVPSTAEWISAVAALAACTVKATAVLIVHDSTIREELFECCRREWGLLG
jgi:hypothetical protein